EHRVEQDALHDGAQAARAGLALDGLAGDGAERLFVDRKLDVLHLEQALELLHKRVLRLLQNLLQGLLVEVLERRHDRQAADELGDQTVLEQILGLHLAEHFARLAVFRRAYRRTEPDRRASPACGDDLVEAGKGTAADKQDIGRIDLQELLLRMLAAALRRNARDRAFHDLEQRLLHALARHVARDRRVV